MDITSLISQDCAFCAVQVNSKKKILEFISEQASLQLPNVSEQEIIDVLLAREKLGSTGIGLGVAIPHGRLKDIDKRLAILVTTEHPVSFDAIDNRPVNVFFSLLLPQSADQKTNLSALAAIAEKLSDKKVLKQVKSASNKEQLYKAIAG